MADALHRIFVYGTLKAGQPNSHLLRSAGRAALVGVAKLADRFPLVIATELGLPALLGQPGTGRDVYGELYEVDDVTLATLDDLEDHPHLYTRTLTHCHLLPKGTTIPPPPLTLSQADAGEPPSNDPTNVGIECEAYIILNFNRDLLKLSSISWYSNDTPGQTKYVAKHTRQLENATEMIYKQIKHEWNKKTEIEN